LTCERIGPPLFPPKDISAGVLHEVFGFFQKSVTYKILCIDRSDQMRTMRRNRVSVDGVRTLTILEAECFRPTLRGRLPKAGLSVLASPRLSDYL